jgi:hypothetical protein
LSNGATVSIDAGGTSRSTSGRADEYTDVYQRPGSSSRPSGNGRPNGGVRSRPQ